MNEKDYHDLSQFVLNSRNGVRLDQVCQYLKANAYSEEGVMFLLQVSRRTKTTLLEELGRSILHFLGSFASFSFESKIILIDLLIDEMEDVLAHELLEEVSLDAISVENFEVLIKLDTRLQKIGFTKKLVAADFSRFSDRYLSLSQLRRWHTEIAHFRKVEDHEQRKEKLELLRRRSLEHYEKNKLGQRELLVFLMIQAKTEFLIGHPKDWINAQEAVVFQLKAYPWISDSLEYDLAHELRILVQLCWHAGDSESYERYKLEFDSMKLVSQRENFERIQQRFPFEFLIALDFGNKTIGMKASKDFIEIASSNQLDQNLAFLSTCQYWYSYFQFSIGNMKEARKMIIASKKIPKGESTHKSIWLNGLLEVICSIQANEFDDAKRLIKNLRYSLKKIPIPGASEALKALSSISKYAESKRHRLQNDSAIRKLEGSLFQISNLEINKYFDFTSWLQSLDGGGSMLDIIAKQRAQTTIK